MATKPPKLTFEAFKDKREAVEIWLDQFNDWCILQSWRDTSKPTSDHDHWKEDCYAKEISAFRLGMPPEVLRNIKTTVVPMMGNDDTAADALDRYSGYPWVWQKLVLRHYSGQDTVLAERMTFLDTCKQKPHETIAEFEARCKYRRVHRGGSPLPMNPPRSFKFRFKFNGICMRAHCARARFRDRSAVFHRMRMHACDVHSTFKDLIVAERARPCNSSSGIRGGELLTVWPRSGAKR